jgi:hypothetical protein
VSGLTQTTQNLNELQPITMGFERKAEISHARNQMNKNHLYVIQKYKNEETLVTMIVNKNMSKQIQLCLDHEFASPDIMHQCPDQHDNHNKNEIVLMQTISISGEDNNMIFETHDFRLGSSEEDKEVRKTKIQDLSAQFPIISYNIGSQKLVILDTLMHHERQYVYKLDPNESFVSFVQFKDLQSLGFHPENLHIEACS